MNWKTDTLSKVADIGDGAHASLKRVENGVPYVTAKNLCPNGLDYSQMTYISEETYTKHFSEKGTAVTQPRKGDILYSIIGSIGEVYEIKNEIIGVSSSIAIFRAKTEIINTKYLAYYLRSKYFENQIQAIKGGVAQGFMSLGKLGEVEIKYPVSLSVQKEIALVLQGFDNLIENNQKQIKLLEEAAQRLYKEWFVDMHFPGYENVDIVDGVPEGWKREKLIDIAQVQYGYAFDGSLFNAESKGMPIIRIRNIPEGITSDYTTEDADEQYIIHNGDIVVGMDGEFHINSWSGKDSYLVQRTCCIRPNNNDMKGWLLYAIYEPIKYFEKTVVGATVAHLGKKHIDTIYLLTGPSELYKPFSQVFAMRQCLLNQNQVLKEARDRLLPKLMSGEIEL